MNLRFEGLKRWYGDKVALDLGHGQINHGRITGIIGPRGAGKSTLLNIIAGLDDPSAGRMMYGYVDKAGNKLFTDKIPRNKMALAFARPYRSTQTVEKAIGEPLRDRGLSAIQIDARVKELMDELGLSGFAKRRGWSLSNDVKHKAALAQALSTHPELLLMDELTSTIAVETTNEIEQTIKRVNEKEGTTIIFVGYNIAQICRLCDEVIFMHQGRILESGSALETLSHPKRRETRAFCEGKLD